MRRAELIWVPYPYKAGFCITDDTDGAELWSVKIVYDFLKSINLPATKTVWIMLPEESCGIPKKVSYPKREMNVSTVTFENKDYREYCRELYERGFEICLHGASSGNNHRERTLWAIEFMKKNFSHTDTYICHSKNAENPYWEEKVTSSKFRRFLLSFFSKHYCSGEDPQSRYFWGDACRNNVKQIRLYRTRNTNTLAVNPAMPYYDPQKPFVRSWFSATKRSFADCTTEVSLTKLKKAHGLTVLYQYLHRYGERESMQVTERFREGALRLAGDREILRDTTANIMNRLRQIQGIFIVYRQNDFWIINTNDREVMDLQIILPNAYHCRNANDTLSQNGSILHIKRINKLSVCEVRGNLKIRFKGRRTGKLNRKFQAVIPFGHGSILVNLSERNNNPAGKTPVGKKCFYLSLKDETLGEQWPVSKIGYFEEIRLFWGQVLIILREVLFKGRRYNIHKFLAGSKLTIEDQENW